MMRVDLRLGLEQVLPIKRSINYFEYLDRHAKGHSGQTMDPRELIMVSPASKSSNAGIFVYESDAFVDEDGNFSFNASSSALLKLSNGNSGKVLLSGPESSYRLITEELEKFAKDQGIVLDTRIEAGEIQTVSYDATVGVYISDEVHNGLLREVMPFRIS